MPWTQRAFRQALLVERYTSNQRVASLSEFVPRLRQSLAASLWVLIAQHRELHLWLEVDLRYRHMFEERTAVGHLTMHTSQHLHNYTTTSKSTMFSTESEEVQFRNANFLRNASPFVVDNIESAVVHVARYAQTQGGI